jgi:hypothetical protein
VVAVPVLKRAESTTTYALIGEVDVSVYNKRDLIFASLLPQRICQAKEAQRLIPEPPQAILIQAILIRILIGKRHTCTLKLHYI